MKTVIELALESADPDKVDPFRNGFWVLTQEELEKFAELVRADERNSWPAEMEAMERQVNILTDALAQAKAEEREACAKVCDRIVEGKDPDDIHSDSQWAALSLAVEIRARSNT